MRCATGSFETVFLTFFGTSITGEHASFLEGGTIFVRFKKRTGDAKTDCFGLASEATTMDISGDIITIFCTKESKRLLEVEKKGFEWEVFLHITAIDSDFSFASADIDAGDGRFTTASAIIFCFVCHNR